MQLVKFDDLISQLLDTHNNTYISHTCDRLLATGENYGSVMLKVEVTIRNQDGQEEIIYCVAKTPPPRSWIWELFTTVVTFKKEVGFYKYVSPALRRFVEEKKLPQLMDFTPKYYGSRINLQETSTEVDEDAVLVLENLKEKNYCSGDRFVGFDLHTSKLIIKNMAVMHATTIAYKQTNPKDFEESLLPHIVAKYKQGLDKETATGLVEFYIQLLGPHVGNLDFLRERLLACFYDKIEKLSKPTEVNHFFTMIQNDMWTNNIMIKLEEGQTKAVKFVDFQIISYLPGSHELIFFLYSSVELPILKEHFNELVEHYYETFISTLTLLQADITNFTKDNFKETIRPAVSYELPHILLLLGPIFTKKGQAKELTEFSPEDFKPKIENIHENFVPRLHFIVTNSIENNWI